ncbi:hypothetical protein [Amycolatopsis cihanbeyliensis]|uniref:Uncharacterized protein n=1 Tax=Amycolatopsis cihanbeyliensis TaxID=1128664 RepID=A0A542DI72_AMYCI|nr:hypothetical protein [Amycolatopsis cihanbeyliensis]TQJ02791.1 hypothetical protein FB471_2536 [Amycolatopsis cihanbeyliensis]
MSEGEEEPEPAGEQESDPGPAGGESAGAGAEASEPAPGGSTTQRADSAAQAVQEQAVTEERAREWSVASERMSAAMQSLLGQGYDRAAANVFLGPATIGTVGTSHAAPVEAGAARSGPVPREVLDRIGASFVPPERYEAVRSGIRRNQMLFLRAQRGSGRTTAALRALDGECRQGVRKLDPETDLSALNAKDLEPNHGYLLESLAPQHASKLSTFHTERIVRLLNECGCRLVVVLDPSSFLRTEEIQHLVVDGLGTVPAREVLRRHLCWSPHGSPDEADRLLDRPDVAELVGELRPDTPRRDLASLATLLVEVGAGRLALAEVRQRYSRLDDSSFAAWFAEQSELDQRAFVIALAVFNGEPVHLVADAAHRLADRFRRIEHPRPSDRARPLFDTTFDQRLDRARAEYAEVIQDTVDGELAVRIVRFRDDAFPRRVLEHVCGQYDQAYDLIRTWLYDLGTEWHEHVRLRAGMAVGLLSLQHFEMMLGELIMPWAADGDEKARWAAVSALQIPLQDPNLTLVVTPKLKHWLRHRTSNPLRVTAAHALGTSTALSPATVLRDLGRAAKQADWDLEVQIARSVAEIVRRDEATDAAFATLLRWIGDGDFPARRETGVLAVLIISTHLRARVDGCATKWPVFVWMHEYRPEHREKMIGLVRELLNAPRFVRRGYAEILRWLRAARKEETMRLPLARLLAAIAEAGDGGSLRFYLNYWLGERGSPKSSIKVVLEHFERGGV